ncbi:MAG: nucleotide exchange factor GrpE [Actinomycetota bacterium]|nr:nucleotide exchange factor GrpE [Actinomycetota bacterium]
MQGTGDGIPVRDKRGTGQGPPAPGPTAGAPEMPAAEVEAPVPAQPDEEMQEGGAPQEQPAQVSYLDDLRRVQAEFANYRKRVMRDQAAAASRASARLIEGLLPVLDNFERALAHGEGEGDAGIELVHKQFKEVLGDEGLEEIPAHDVAFDPTVHEAVEAKESADVEEPTSVSVYRKGYRLKGQVVRPAMVVVARPIEPSQTDGAEPIVAQDDSDSAEGQG